MGDQAERLRQLVKRKQEQPLRIITVTSGKGGVGKSFLTVNLAIALKALGVRVLVIDADFGLANIDIMLGSASAYNLKSVLSGEKELHEIIQEGYNGVKFISGGNGIYELLNMDDDSVTRILDKMTGLGGLADTVIVDTGAGINSHILQLILASTEVVVVTTPEPTSLVDAYAMIKTICEARYTSDIHLVINRAQSGREAENAGTSLSVVVYRNLGITLSVLGSVAYDPEVFRSISQFTPLLIRHPRNSASRDVESIAQKLQGIVPAGGQRGTGSLSRFFSTMQNKAAGTEKRE